MHLLFDDLTEPLHRYAAGEQTASVGVVSDQKICAVRFLQGRAAMAGDVDDYQVVRFLLPCLTIFSPSWGDDIVPGGIPIDQKFDMVGLKVTGTGDKFGKISRVFCRIFEIYFRIFEVADANAKAPFVGDWFTVRRSGGCFFRIGGLGPPRLIQARIFSKSELASAALAHHRSYFERSRHQPDCPDHAACRAALILIEWIVGIASRCFVQR